MTLDGIGYVRENYVEGSTARMKSLTVLFHDRLPPILPPRMLLSYWQMMALKSRSVTTYYYEGFYMLKAAYDRQTRSWR